MFIKTLLKRRTYYDSITLMRLAQAVKESPEVDDVGAVMATAANCELLRNSALLADDWLAQQMPPPEPSDLLITVRTVDEAYAEAALRVAEQHLIARPASTTDVPTQTPARSLEIALERNRDADLAFIAVAGEHAWLEAEQALRQGLHVFLFSDNVPLEQERRLKALALERNLLLMGPDCGTAVINGVGLGFSNVVPSGPIGFVGASGTGMQQVMSLSAAADIGISQAIGTGGRDLSEAIGGAMMRRGLALLANDEQTSVIVLISKPPAASVVRAILAEARIDKPVVVVFLGADTQQFMPVAENIVFAQTLTEAAMLAVQLAGGDASRVPQAETSRSSDGEKLARLRERLAPSQRFVRALYSGGTLCDEAMLVLEQHLGSAIASNIPLKSGHKLAKGESYRGHMALDLGSDEFTRGHPHPMIDASMRLHHLAQAAQDPETAVILLDIVLGYCAHPNPSAVYAPAILAARSQAQAHGRELPIVISLCGTEGDPQQLSMQRAALEAAGALVYTSNAAAALAATYLVSEHVATSNIAVGTDVSRPGVKMGTSQNAIHRSLPSFMGEVGRDESVPTIVGEGVIHVGSDLFADALKAQDVAVTHVAWQPSAGESDDALSRVLWDERIGQANQIAVQRMMAARPRLVDVRPAREVIAGMHQRLLLHAGPPVTWERMSGPLRGAILGALLYEGLAADSTEAERLAQSGEIAFAPCHHYNAVGPMAGVISASMPVQIIEDPIYGHQTYSTLNEGLGKVLRYGANDVEVLTRLRWLEQVLGPALGRAVRAVGGIEIKSLTTQALQMGDECHNRNKAATSLFIRQLAPALVETGMSNVETANVLRFLNGNDHFYLNLSMAACKAAALAAHGIAHSSIVTTMARNGTDFGIRVSGLGERWYVGPAQHIEGLYFSGFSAQDANPDIGDSTISETVGIGAFAMAAAPAIVQFVGGTPADAIRYTTEMYDITVAEESQYQLPPLNFRGTPIGIDIRQVVRQNLLPIINTGIAHRLPGVGQVGAGIVRPPMECFVAALRDLAA